MSWLGVLCHRCAHITTAFTCDWSDYPAWIVASVTMLFSNQFHIAHGWSAIGFCVVFFQPLPPTTLAFTIYVYQVVFTHVKHRGSAGRTELVQTAAKIKMRAYFPHYTRKKKKTWLKCSRDLSTVRLIEAAVWTVVASYYLEYLKMNVDDEPCHNQTKPCLY